MDEKILREILSVTKENNEILRKLNLQRRWVNYVWIFKWVLFATLAYSAYIASKPYIDQAQATYNQAQNAINSLNAFSPQPTGTQAIDEKTFTEFLTNEVKKRLGQ